MGILSRRIVSPEVLISVYRYGMLVLLLGLLMHHIYWHLTLPPSYHGDPYSLYVVVLMLLFQHMGFVFKWPKQVGVILRVLAYSWTVLAIFSS